jgi:small-conductance mechanosensitive channel
MEQLRAVQWIAPVVFIFAGYAVGKIFEHLVIKRLKALAKQSAWRADDILLESLGRTTTIWFLLGGFYGAVETMPLSADLAAFLRKALFIAFVASGTLLIARLGVNYVNLYAMQVRGILPSTTIFSNLTRALIYIIGVLVILQTLGISITPILTALGVGGLAVALALQDTLSNFFAGLQIIGSGQVKPGEFIRLESGEEGYVVDVTWRNTTIRQLPNNMVIIPNAHLASSRVTNFDRPDKEQAILVQVGVSYGSDLEKVERVTIDVARDIMQSVQGGIPEFQPFIRYHTFADFSINFTVIMRGREFVDQYLVKHEFVKRLHERYARESIEIPYPIRTVHLKREQHA